MKKVPIIALCTLIIANCGIAAKLCVLNANAYSYAYNPSSGIWAVGVGCGEFHGGQDTGNKTGTTPAELCTGQVVISGTFDVLTGAGCSCKADYPITLFPRFISTADINCGKFCGNVFKTTPDGAILL